MEQTEKETTEFYPGFPTQKEFIEKMTRTMATATQSFQKLPSAGSPIWDLRKSYPEFNRGLKSYRTRIINDMIKVMQHAKIPIGDFKRRDVDEKFDFLVDANDDILERINTSIDQAEGLFKRAEILVVNPSATGTANPPGVWKEKKMQRLNAGPEPQISVASSSSAGSNVQQRKFKRAIFRHGRIKTKPQEEFETPIDNTSAPFAPRLREKPHSIKPLSILPQYSEDNQEFFGHPYEVELDLWKPIDHMVLPSKPKYPAPEEETPLIFVDNVEDLDHMIDDLTKQNEIAVDLEHHSYRSYQGFTCLMQISTRSTDYIVDGLLIRDEMYRLNEVFANPKILKVFHGASSDILWLQKDFSCYVVGMFDTGVAAKLLEFSQLSLQYLLNEICKTSTDKSYQLADWRMRPLPADMLEYARKDTHYLLYIYDVLKNRLLDSKANVDLLNLTYQQSRMVCLQRYEKPLHNPQVAIRKCKKTFNNRQLHGFVELFKWRDMVARKFDESLGFVLPNHMLQTIAETLPKEMTGILACCDPVPMLLNQHLADVHQIVTEARELPLHTQEATLQVKTQRKAKTNWLNALDSIHDYGSQRGHSYFNLYESTCSTAAPSAPWWSSIDASDIPEKTPVLAFKEVVNVRTNGIISGFSPYQRYKMTHEILQQLNDPNKKTTVDMSNPLVKTVVETIQFEEEPEIIEEQQPASEPKARKSTLMDQDFVPFNPMSLKPSEEKHGKKRKLESEDEEDAYEGGEKRFQRDPNVLERFAAGDNSDLSDNSDKETKAKPVISGSVKGQSRSAKKRQRKNLLKRLMHRGKKHKFSGSNQQSPEEPEDGELSNESREEETPSAIDQKPANTKSKFQSPNSSRGGRRNMVPNPHHRSNNQTDQKKKRGWFRGSKEGKSMTFKR